MDDFEAYYNNLKSSVSGGSSKDDDFNKFYDGLKMDIGSIADTRPKKPVIDPLAKPVRPTRMDMVNPSVEVMNTRTPINGPVEMDEEAPAMDIETKARQVPVLGSVLKGLDYIAEKTEPVAKVMRDFYVPGAGLANIAGLTNAAEAGVAKLLPKLGNSLGGRVAQKALSEGLVGAPLGAAQSQMVNPDADVADLAKGAAYGAIGGAALGGLGKGVGELAQRYTDNIAEALGKNAIQNVAYNSRFVSSPFSEGAALSNPIAKGYTEEVGKTFGQKSGVQRLRELVDKSPETPQIQTQIDPVPLKQEPTVSELVTLQESPTIKPAVKPTNPTKQLRGFAETLINSDKTPEGFTEKLKLMYKPTSNEETLSLANKRLEKDIEESTSFVLGKSRFTAEKAATAQRLIDHYNSAGNFQRAVDIAEKVSEEATRAGQAIQALSMYDRLSVEGVLIYAQRLARKTNENLTVVGKEVKVTEDMAAKLTGLAQVTQKMTGVKDLSNDVMNILERAKAGEKLSETESATLKRFVSESKQFISETTRKPRPLREPRQPKDKRVRDNVVSFLDSQEQAAKDRLRAKGIRISSTPLDVWADYAIIGAAKMAKGSIKFADWSEQIVKDLGEEIRPHLQNLYERSVEAFEQTNSKISKSVYGRADKAVSQMSADKEELNAITMELSEKVKNIIAKAKTGNVVDAELQEVRDLSDELTDLLPEQQSLATPEMKYIQAVKSLSKKLSGVESERVPTEQSVKEVQQLLSTISKLADEGKPKLPKAEKDTSIEDLGYMLMERTKPRVLSEQEKITERFIKKAGTSLSNDQIDSIRSLAQKVSAVSGEEKRIASQDLQVILRQLDKPTILKRVSSVQTMGQLLNPKTQVRNALGNELFYRVERLNKLIATPIDIARSKITGGERTVTFRTNNQGEYWKNWMRGVKAGWKGANVNGLETQYDLASPAFKGKYNPLTYLEKALGASLKSFDTAAYMRAYNNSIGELSTLRAINEGQGGNKELISKYIREADENIKTIADEYGKYATFQDNNIISKGLTNLKKGLNFKQDFGIGDLVLKYPKTPGALLMRALEYSPAGFVRSASILARPWFKKEPNTAEVTQALSRAIIGTMGLSGMGYYLLDKGVLTGSASKDKDVRDLQRSAGQGQYQINLSAMKRLVQSGFNAESAKLQEGDSLYTYDWMQPISMAISIGANTSKNISEGNGKFSGTIGTVYNSLEGGLGTLTEQSVLSGVKNAAQGYPGQTVTDKIMDILGTIPSSFVPTAANQYRTLTDNAKRETYSPNKLEQSLNVAQAKIPGLADNLPQQYDTLGRPKTTMQDNNAFNVLFNPGSSSKYELSHEAKWIVDLINESGDESVAPRVPSKYITVEGEKVVLNGDQFSRLQQLQGEETRDQLNKKYNPSSTLKNRVDKVQSVLTDSGKDARKKLQKEMGR